MDIQASKIELAKIILSIENPELINKIKNIIVDDTEDFWLRLTSTEKDEIEFGLSQLDKGLRISADDFLSSIS